VARASLRTQVVAMVSGGFGKPIGPGQCAHWLLFFHELEGFLPGITTLFSHQTGSFPVHDLPPSLLRRALFE